MNETSPSENIRGNTKMCSVLFVDIIGYSKKTNAEQIHLKQQFVTLWAQAIKDVPPSDVMVVDAGDGAALTALVEPEDTLRVAMALRDATEEDSKRNQRLPIRMGINFGPVQLGTDVHGKACIVGDAINIAQRIMSFADDGQITISRSYYDTIKPMNSKYEEMFYYLGQRSDKHVRHHHIYGLGKPAQSAQMGNSSTQDFGSIIEDDDLAEETGAPHTPPPLRPAGEPYFKETSAISSATQTVGGAIMGFIRWILFIIPLLVVGYELLVLVPLINKPGAVNEEITRQIHVVTQYAKNQLGIKETVGGIDAAAPAEPESKKADTPGTKHHKAVTSTPSSAPSDGK